MGRGRALICTGFLVTAACDAGVPDATRAPDASRSYRLDFGVVAVGSGRTLRLQVQNPGGREGAVQVEGVVPPFEGPADPIAVLPGRTVIDVPFAFRPLTTAPLVMTVLVHTPAGDRKLLLAGAGTVSAIRCAMEEEDLGIVLVPGSAEGTVRCTSELDERVALRLGPFEDPTGLLGRLFTFPDGDTLAVPARGSATARLRLDATVVADVEATVPIRDPAGARYDVPVRARMVRSLLSVEPGDVDFGGIEPGQVVQRTVKLVNLGSSPIALALDGPATVGPFEVAQLPLQIRADDPRTATAENVANVQLRFRPQTYGLTSHVWSVKLSGDSRLRSRLEIPVRGTGGGPQLACDPAVDFGQVALGLSFPRTLSCRNVGVSGGPLRLFSVTTGSHEFVMDLAAPPNPRATPEGFAIDLLFVPEAGGSRSSIVTVASNGGTVQVPVTGEGERYDGCDFEVLPLRGLDFGTVEPGRSISLEVTVSNRGTGPCLVRNLGISAGSSPVFGAAPVDTAEIAASGQLVVPVTVTAPDELGQVTGSIEFWISRPGASRQRVALRAELASGCLRFAPSLLELGRVPIGCRGLPGTVTVRNSCRTPVSVLGLGLASTFSTSFELVDPPAAPFVVPASGSVPLHVAYRPTQARIERGGVLLRTQDGVEFIATVQGLGLAEGEPLERFSNSRAVDVLVVADDSSAMEELRDGAGTLGTNLARALFDRGTDFQLGVTGTSLKECDGGVHVPDGRLLPLEGLRIVRRFDQGFASFFGRNVQVPTCSDEQAGLQAALTALTPPLSTSIDDERHPEARDGNLGFLRTATELAVVFLTASEDRSPGPPSDYADALLGLARSRITAHAIGPSVDGCRHGSGRYEEVVHATGGHSLSICAPDWSSEVTASALAAAIAPDRLRYPLAGEPPDLDGDARITEAAGEILVTVAGEPVPSRDAAGKRWSLVGNALEFEPGRAPPPGASIGVRYGVTCE